MSRKKTQLDAILHYLQTHKNGLTSLEAFELLGVTRLSGQVYNLKRKGYEIEAEDVQVVNRYGSTVIVTRYRLVEGE